MHFWCCPLSEVSFVSAVLLCVFALFLFSLLFRSLSRLVLWVQKGSALVSIVKVVLVVGILFTYPLQLVPVIQALETWMESDSPFEPLSLSSASSSPGASPRAASPTLEELEEEGLGRVGGMSHSPPGGEYASCTLRASGAIVGWGLGRRAPSETPVRVSLARIGGS